MTGLPSPLKIWRSWSVRRRALVVGSTCVVVAGAILAAYLITKRPADVSNPSAPFTHREARPPLKVVNWPIYGLNPERTRYLPAKGINPPLGKPAWKFNAGNLLEFSPIYVNDSRSKAPAKGKHGKPGSAKREKAAKPGTKPRWQGHLYVMDKNATFFSLNARTGKVVWKHKIGTLNASSPAYYHGVLYAVNLAPGQVVALRARDGKELWRKPLPGRTESSPLIHGGRVYVGCENGQVFALDAKTGRTDWTVSTGGAVKGGVAYDRGKVFFGNYAGQVYAVDAGNGQVRWQQETLGGGFLRGGGIYSTPAIAFGRVYFGGLDGRVYSYVEKTGELAWSQTLSAGNEVYAAPAVAGRSGLPPTVFIGSRDQYFYALDARTGQLRWKQRVGGPVLGAASIIGRTVYMAVIGPNVGSFGFDARDGRTVFHSDLGEYNPMISDGRHLYLTGSVQIRAFRPKLGPPARHGKKNAKHSARGGHGKKAKGAQHKQRGRGNAKPASHHTGKH
jgi:outer membrane protein assembly factor BamB